MKRSSSNQLQFDYGDDAALGRQGIYSIDASDQSAADTLTISEPISLPRFEGYGGAHAITARMAGRLNAASVSEREHQELLRERQLLLDKKLSGEITRQELNKLEYIRWSLDRIEDAKHGLTLDTLDAYVSKYEQLAKDLKDLEAKLFGHLSTRRK